MENLNTELRSWLFKNKKNQLDLAQYAGVTVQTVGRWLRLVDPHKPDKKNAISIQNFTGGDIKATDIDPSYKD